MREAMIWAKIKTGDEHSIQAQKCKIRSAGDKNGGFNEQLYLLRIHALLNYPVCLLNIMQPQHSDDEGFFSEHIEIKHSELANSKSPTLLTRTHFNKSPFEPKVLPWTGIFKKEPPGSFITDSCLRSEQVEVPERRKTKPSNKDHPYRLFASNPMYQLVYCRSLGEPITNGADFMNNEVKLEHLGDSSFMQYRKIKGFDEDAQPGRLGVLKLDSRFECGNLHCAYKHEKAQEYVLFIQNDTNSLGYNQWFYFSAEGIQARTKYTFRLMNFKKKHSFFKYGCKPAVYSRAQLEREGNGWSRKATNVIYEQSPIHIPELPDRKFYALSFDLTFDTDDDFIMIAMGLPYSYSKLISCLKNAENEAQNDPQLQFSIKSVSRTVCGNDVPEVSITRKSEVQNKKIIIFMARQHPGEVWSSYMMEGVIRKLVSSHPPESITWLLQNYQIIIYPMINVDGVIYGNFRCDITGVDLNRRWKEASKLLQPQVYDIKKKIMNHRSRARVDCVYDLHGHSKNYNVFAYSCKDNSFTCRILPFLISQINPAFYFPSCTFGISKYKETTARATIYKIVKNENVLTIESSFYGSKLGGVSREFVPKDLLKLGEDILEATRGFVDKKGKVYLGAKKEIESRIKEFMKYDEVNEFDSGSESDPEGDEIDLETKISKIFNNNFITRSTLKLPKKQPPKISPNKTRIEQNPSNIQIKSKQYEKKRHGIVSSLHMKEIPMHRKPSQTIEPDAKPSETNRINFKGRSKQTISYSQQKDYQDAGKREELIKSKVVFREKQKKFTLGALQEQPRTERRLKDKRSKILSQSISGEPQMVEAAGLQREEHSEMVQDHRASDEFTRKFEKFIPASMAMKNRMNASLFEESLYNEDQSNLISMLLENKRKIEQEKIKRDVQKSTNLVERQGKIKMGGRKQKVVNFRTFKQNENASKKVGHWHRYDVLPYI